MMFWLLLFCACVVRLTVGWSSPPYDLEQAESYFKLFMKEYDRVYSCEHVKQARFQIFKDNLERANRMNDDSENAVYGITSFMDLTPEEFEKKYAGARKGGSELQTSCTDLSDKDVEYKDVPESFDWRDLNAVTGVKDQGPCGSCYAFSTIGNVESQYAIKYKQQIVLSEKQILDCDRGSFGCQEGYVSSAMQTLIKQGGAESEDDYPYQPLPRSCQFDASKVRVQVTDCLVYNLTSQEKVKQLLYHNGPLSIHVRQRPLQMFYNHGGIISNRQCSEGELNHAVLLVGYGSENGMPYWIVKNSWRYSWGERGFFRMERGEHLDSCGMMSGLILTTIIA